MTYDRRHALVVRILETSDESLNETASAIIRTLDHEGRPMLSVGAAARRIGVHPNTLKRLLKRGAITGVRINARGDWRVDPDALQRYVDEVKTPTVLKEKT